jgi:hypothetical protein
VQTAKLETMSDTRPEAQALLDEIRRRQTPRERLTPMLELSEALRLQALARLRAQDPNASELELVRRLVRERYGIELPTTDR